MSPDRHVSRRRVLRTAGASAATLFAGTAALPAPAAAQSEAYTVDIDQEVSDADSITVSESYAGAGRIGETGTPVHVENQLRERVGGPGEIVGASGDEARRTIELEQPLSEPQPVRVVRYHPESGEPVATDRAFLDLGEDGAEPASGPSLSVDEAASDADTVVLESVRTNVDASLFVLDGGSELGGEGLRLLAGANVEDVSIPLTTTLEDGQAVEVTLLESNAGQIAGETYVFGEAASDVTLLVDDQTSTGDSIAVDELATDVDASLFVRDAEGNAVGGSGVTFQAGESVEDLEVPLETPLEETQSVSVVLYESNAGQIASDEAQVTVEAPACGGVEGADVQTVGGTEVCDLDGDGLYRDVTADGTVDEADVAAFFRHQHREAWKRPEYFDFSGNDRVTHGDVIALFQDVAATVA